MIILFSSTSSILFSQRPFYKISATLSPSAVSLTGTIDISYTNNSNVSLDKLAIHLWPNAYKERNTTLVEQKLNQGDLTLYRTSEENLGGLFDLNFTSPDQPINLNVDDKNADIAWIKLSQPLSPGSTIHLNSPYTLKIPLSFSRIGRTSTSYQLSQWYPHIAVLDSAGWHTMPYLDQGEYYNDFADYEVTVTMPKEYKIAATGELISSQEKSQSTEWVFHASNVIDFAWFADRDFIKSTKQVDVGRDKTVELQIFSHGNLANWDQAMTYGERALRFYSEWLGPYPYDNMSVVYTPFSKAGYMEYPMVAEIGFTSDAEYLDRVIAHEIGHTWLYGILANNERENPWLDEGFNTFLENLYMEEYYDHPVESTFPKILHSKYSMPDYDAYQHFIRATGKMQPPLSPPERQSSEQYLFSAYYLPLEGLNFMLSEVGHEKMKQMLRNYYAQHKFTHVSLADVKTSFESSCKCDLTWFFNEWLNHAHEMDYRFKNIDFQKNTLTLQNRSGALLPVAVSEFSKDKEISKTWIDGFQGEKTIALRDETDEIRLNDGMMAPNKKWWDNIRPRDLLPVVSILPKVGNYEKPSISVTPFIGFNVTDGGMPGVAITTDLIPQPRLKLLAMPMYGIESKQFRFYSEGRYITDLHTSAFDKLLLGFAAQSFGYNLDTHYLFRDHFVKLSPTLAVRFKNSSDYSHHTSWLKYRYVDIQQYYGRGLDFIQHIYTGEKRTYGIHELSIQTSSDTVTMPYNAKAAIQVGEGFVRVNLNYNQHFRGKDKMRGVWVHGFAGWLPLYDNPKANVLFTFNGMASSGFFSRDYMYDEWLMGRNAIDGNVSRQVFLKDAGLKTLSTIGISDKWMAGAGASYALPFKVVHIYMDAALYPSSISEKVTLSYSGGLAIVVMKDVFEIYIPILESKDIRESLSYQVRDQWFDRISFQANFKLANPLKIIDQLQFKY